MSGACRCDVPERGRGGACARCGSHFDAYALDRLEQVERARERVRRTMKKVRGDRR